MDEVINDMKKLKIRNCSQLVKNRKAWNDMVHRTQTHVRVALSEEKKKEILSYEFCFSVCKSRQVAQTALHSAITRASQCRLQVDHSAENQT